MSESSPDSRFRSGFVAIIGRPNVGKSTLVNRLAGQKIAIATPVPLTTRRRAHGILTLPDAQIIFVDTPGIHHARDQLGKRMVAMTRRVLTEVDAIVCIIDAARGMTREDHLVVSLLRTVTAPVLVALNKADRVASEHLAAMAAVAPAISTCHTLLPISATAGTNLDRLLETLITLLPAGPQYFPAELYTDQPEQVLIEELIREQVITCTREEVPHGVAVKIEEFTPRPGQDLVYIRAVLHVERESHKKILIGRQGRLLKQIGQQARGQIEGLRGTRVYLDLWVKVSERWRDRDDLIRVFYPE